MEVSRDSLVLLAGLCLLVAPPTAPAQSCEPFEVLVFHKTAGFNHAAQIAAGTALIESLGAANGFGVDSTDDAARIAPANLAQYAAVIFLHTTGDILTPAQETAFEGYILGGGGFVGVHSAADTEYGWPFYGTLLGAYFASHPAVQAGVVSVVDPLHPSTATLPGVFTHTDEWYNFQTNVAANPGVDVLLTVDESSYVGGTMGPVHPIAWYQDFGISRSWYTAMGHDLSTYSAPFFHDHLLGGILWAADSSRATTICGAQAYGAASGSPSLQLGASAISPTTGSLNLSGGTPGAAGFLILSRCPASVSFGSLTVLVDLAAPGFLGFLPAVFDAAGQWQLPVPLAFQSPGSFGNSIFLQGAQVGPTLGASNGLELVLCH